MSNLSRVDLKSIPGRVIKKKTKKGSQRLKEIGSVCPVAVTRVMSGVLATVFQ